MSARQSDRLRDARAAMASAREVVQLLAQPRSLFDAQVERDEAITHTADTHRGQLLGELDAVLRSVAASGQPFTVDDVRDAMEAEHVGVGTDLKVLGAVLRRAAQHGDIVAIGYAPSRRRHASPLRLWKTTNR